jgi:hypothetical protein
MPPHVQGRSAGAGRGGRAGRKAHAKNAASMSTMARAIAYLIIIGGFRCGRKDGATQGRAGGALVFQAYLGSQGRGDLGHGVEGLRREAHAVR